MGCGFCAQLALVLGIVFSLVWLRITLDYRVDEMRIIIGCSVASHPSYTVVGTS